MKKSMENWGNSYLFLLFFLLTGNVFGWEAKNYSAAPKRHFGSLGLGFVSGVAYDHSAAEAICKERHLSLPSLEQHASLNKRQIFMTHLVPSSIDQHNESTVSMLWTNEGLSVMVGENLIYRDKELKFPRPDGLQILGQNSDELKILKGKASFQDVSNEKVLNSYFKAVKFGVPVLCLSNVDEWEDDDQEETEEDISDKDLEDVGENEELVQITGMLDKVFSIERNLSTPSYTTASPLPPYVRSTSSPRPTSTPRSSSLSSNPIPIRSPTPKNFDALVHHFSKRQ